MMETALIDTALTQSVWAGLALVLIFYILKKQEARDSVQAEREMKYQMIIQQLSQKVGVCEEVRADIKEIKTIVAGS